MSCTKGSICDYHAFKSASHNEMGMRRQFRTNRYKQTLNDTEYSDGHPFSITLVPLRLVDKEANHKQDRTPGEKNSVAARKATIQQKFLTEMGLLVDMPKQSAGNTNDGNTARRFFRNTEKTAEITGIEADLIHHFRVLLEALSSNHEIDCISCLCEKDKKKLLAALLLVLYACQHS
ncbi:unnamed protein product [Chilo suppressalis]|uniref:SCA7 domain-containing protein n=1 Tax=Chilo suppressalis TaxID=168631 RepID=A0ABN8B4T7_CHISP|nr:unnamed protein product [Chilo suppressalis]